MKLDEKNWLKISGSCGVLAPIVALGCIFLAIASWHEFSWANNALSDLGTIPGITRLLFNNGLIFGGLLALVFASGFFSFLKGWKYGKYAAALFCLDTVALAAIGFFPEGSQPAGIHFAVSVAFFVLFPLSGFLITAALFKIRRKRLGWLTLALAVLAAAAWLAHFVSPFGSGVAIPEMIASLSAGAWAVVAGISMLQAGRS